MSIAQVIAYPIGAPQPQASGRTGLAKSLVVEVVTTDGRSGFGEAFSPAAPQAAARIVTDLFAPLITGSDATAIGALWERMRAALVTPPAGAGAEAVSAIDIALWDLNGQRLGAPVSRLLGGAGRTRLAAYASFIGWTDDATARATAERALALGFRQMKVKVSAPLDAALARVAFIRDVVGPDVGLVVDPNGAFSRTEAATFARRLAALGYLWLEEPVDPADHAGLAWLAGLGLLPIAAGESEYGPRGAAALVAAGAADILQPDCGRVGGITGFVRAAHATSAFGIPFAPHHAGGAIKAAAALQLAAALPGFRVMECSLNRTALADELTTTPVAHPDLLDTDGCLPVPDGPGLGISVDRGALERLTLH